MLRLGEASGFRVESQGELRDHHALPVGVEVEELAGKITACTFHQLCYRAARALGQSFDIPEGREEARAFWAERAPEFLLEAADAGRLRFDAVVVDEAQDLETEWWVAIVGLVPDDGLLWVFCDPDQDIYDRINAKYGTNVEMRLTKFFEEMKAEDK